MAEKSLEERIQLLQEEIKSRAGEAEEIFDVTKRLVEQLSQSVTTIFGVEDRSSSILQAVAWSMWNQCMKLYEEGLAKPQHDFYDINEFIEYVKSSGVPEEIRSNPISLIKVLGAGYATWFDKVEVDSELWRKVAYRRMGRRPGSDLNPQPFKPLPEDQLVEELQRHKAPEWPELKQVIEKRGDTIFWELEAPKIGGKYACGMAIAILGIVPPSLKLCIADSYVPKCWVETLLRRPVEVEFVDGPGAREGATSCDVRIHLRPSLHVYREGL